MNPIAEAAGTWNVMHLGALGGMRLADVEPDVNELPARISLDPAHGSRRHGHACD